MLDVTVMTVEVQQILNMYVYCMNGGAHDAFVGYLNNIPTGKLVMVAVGDEAGLTYYSGEAR